MNHYDVEFSDLAEAELIESIIWALLFGAKKLPFDGQEILETKLKHSLPVFR